MEELWASLGYEMMENGFGGWGGCPLDDAQCMIHELGNGPYKDVHSIPLKGAESRNA